jgi:tetratricopeptide (TPR) repeat protein
MMRGSSTLVGLCLLLLVPPVTLAQSGGDQARARELYEQGTEAAEQGDLDSAIDALSRSHALLPLPGTLYDLALYQERAGNSVEALTCWAELIDRFGDRISSQARTLALGQIERLGANAARVVVTTEPPGALLVVDGEERGPTPLERPIFLEPGTHRFEARLEGYAPAEIVRDLEGGSEREVVLVLPEIVDEPAVPPPEAVETLEPADPDSDDAPTPRRRGFWRGPWPWVIGGLLLVGAGVTIGAVFWPDDVEADSNLRIP